MKTGHGVCQKCAACHARIETMRGIEYAGVSILCRECIGRHHYARGRGISELFAAEHYPGGAFATAEETHGMTPEGGERT